MSEERFAEGRREPSECRKCGQPVWIVYHGPRANHTVEPRVDARWAEVAHDLAEALARQSVKPGTPLPSTGRALAAYRALAGEEKP